MKIKALIAAVCLCATGCNSPARNLTPGASDASAYAPTKSGLNQLLSKLPTLPATAQKAELRAFCDSNADNVLKERSAYVLARKLQQSAAEGELPEAIQRYKQASNLPALAERSLWHQIECAQAMGDEQALRGLGETYATSKATTKEQKAATRYAIGQSFMRTAELDKAREQFAQVVALAPESQYAIATHYYLSQIIIAENTPPRNVASASEQAGSAFPSGNRLASAVTKPPLAPPQAIAKMRHYLQAGPDGRFAIEIVSQLLHMEGFEPTAEDHNTFARVYYTQGAYNGALSEWRKAGNTSEWYKQAMCLLKIGRKVEGEDALAAGISAHPSDSAVVPAATALCKLLKKDGAIAVWKKVLRSSPKYADVAMFNLATRAPADEGVPYYKDILTSFPNSKHASDAGWWYAWSQIQKGDTPGALSILEKTAASYPDSKAAPRCLYWIGKLHERTGQKELAQNAYQRTVRMHARSYYGHRAVARLAAISGGRDRGWSINPGRRVKWTQDTADEWSFPEPPAKLAKEEGSTLETLTELKQWDECLTLSKDKGGLLKAFYLAKLNQALEAINAAYSSLGIAPQPTEAWQLAYPLLYARVIAREAPAKKLDPFLVQALIREESRYNTQALSSSRAIGLMQLMPGTAYGVAKRLGIHLSGNQDIHKPENNLRMGIDYLSYVLSRHNGNALYAVASYNGGPNAVAHWATKWGAGDTDVFVENIPFTETRDYVKKVFGSYWNYEAIYGPQENKQTAAAQAIRIAHP